MVNIPFRFKTINIDSLCESSGSDHSAEDDLAELFDLVNLFIEKNVNERVDRERDVEEEKERTFFCAENDLERKKILEGLFGVHNEDEEKVIIHRKIELACKDMGVSSSDEGLKRELISRLRLSGLDAGLCKSRLKKISHFPAGDYEYMDVITAKARYIVEISLSKEFTIARPTEHYQALLDLFPKIFVGRADELKQVVRLMCAAGKESMKRKDMQVPPWRKNGFMQAKWFGSYKRRTNAFSSKHACYSVMDVDRKRSVGFENSMESFGYSRTALGRKVGLRVGKLAQLLNS